MDNYNLTRINKFLPEKIKTRLRKTTQGRSGNEIYKRRNRRSTRVLLQYITWKKIIKENETFLNNFKEGYAVMIPPKNYFNGDLKSFNKKHSKKLELSKNAFVFYTLLSEYKKYPPKPSWKEVLEISEEGKLDDYTSWTGDYVLNIKNCGKNDQKISQICTKQYEGKENKIKRIFSERNINIDHIPTQSGLGNYDFDYADNKTRENIKYQILYLILSSKTKTGESYTDFIIKNYEDIKHEKDSKTFKKYMKKENHDKFKKEYKEEFKLFVQECEKRNLLSLDQLRKIGSVNKNKNTICPLCYKEIYLEEFFDEIQQDEGRRVLDNTQTAIVLMHIKSLKPGELNHKPYNLGWGHHYCNLIQGPKDIGETITDLRQIIKYHEENKKLL